MLPGSSFIASSFTGSGRTISFEVGLQNAGMATGLAKELGNLATHGLVPIVFEPVMNLISFAVADLWRSQPVAVDCVESSET